MRNVIHRNLWGFKEERASLQIVGFSALEHVWGRPHAAQDPQAGLPERGVT